MPAKSVSQDAPSLDDDRRYFDVDQANRSLIYVSRVVDDICLTYQAALKIQQRRENLIAEHAEPLREKYDEQVDRLNDLVEELHQVGVEITDYEVGLIDFPAVHDGREIALSWKRGEDAVLAWHELDAGYTGRQPVDLLLKGMTSKN